MKIIHIIDELQRELHKLKTELQLSGVCCEFATKQDLRQMEERIMSAISKFATDQKAFNERQAAAIDSLVKSQAGIVDDIKSLNDKITELQNSQGTVSPEDQSLIDGLQTEGAALVAKTEAAAAALKLLDEQIPPTPPPAPPA